MKMSPVFRNMLDQAKSEVSLPQMTRRIGGLVFASITSISTFSAIIAAAADKPLIALSYGAVTAAAGYVTYRCARAEIRSSAAIRQKYDI